MTGKEKFWSEYDRLDAIMLNRFTPENELKNEKNTKNERIQTEKEYRLRAMSNKWVSYELLQAEYEVIDNPVERIQKLTSLQYLNEHDSYLMSESFIRSDYKYFLKKIDEYLAVLDLLKDSQRKSNEAENENNWERVSCYESAVSLYIEKSNRAKRALYAARKKIVQSIFDQEDYKKLEIKRDNNNQIQICITRYQDSRHDKVLYTAEVPGFALADEILKTPEFAQRLTIEERKEFQKYIFL